jgi:transcriptional regulator with XRE-family HTH domain
MREARGLSLDTLGRQSGVGFSYLGRVERGQVASPGLHAILRICQALGVTVSDLLVEAGLEAAPCGYTAPHLAPDSPATTAALRAAVDELKEEIRRCR